MAAPNSFSLTGCSKLLYAILDKTLYGVSVRFMNHFVEDTNKKGQHKRQWKHVSQRDDFLRCIIFKYTTAKENVIS